MSFAVVRVKHPSMKTGFYNNRNWSKAPERGLNRRAEEIEYLSRRSAVDFVNGYKTLAPR